MTSESSLFDRNLAALARYAPVVHAQVIGIKSTETKLVFTEDGQADISLGGQLLYGGQSRRLVEQPNFNAEWMKTAGEIIACSDPMLDKLTCNFEAELKNRGIRQLQSPSPPFFHLIAVGVGLGLHIPGLVRVSGCRSLIVIEPIAEFFVHSLHVIDWAALIEHFAKQGGGVEFCIGQTSEQAGNQAVAVVARYGHAFIDGALCFLHYRNSETEASGAAVRLKLDNQVAFGWLEDEMVMLSNSAANLSQYEWLLYNRPAAEHSGLPPVFIIGAGPSFDDAIEIVRAYKDRVLIGSCGTALGQLLANGISPDFHFEIENEHVTFKVLETLSSKYDLENITLVGPSVLDFGIAPLFPERILFFRPNMAANYLFNAAGKKAALLMPYPNAANVATSFFQEIGCREFYYFGIDLGFKDQNQHHSRFSPYMEEGRNIYMGDMEINSGWNFNTIAQANFGGTSHSNEIGILTRDRLQDSLKYFENDKRYFNCSDGLLIEGATPTRPEAVRISADTPDKHEAKRRVLAGFPPYKREDFVKAWQRDDWMKRAKNRISELRNALVLRENDTPGISLARLLGEMPTRLSEGRGTVEDHVFCGTLALAARTAYKAISRADPLSRRAEVEEFAREEILRILDEMESRYHEVLTQISQLAD
jgi:hypothetical protein